MTDETGDNAFTDFMADALEEATEETTDETTEADDSDEAPAEWDEAEPREEADEDEEEEDDSIPELDASITDEKARSRWEQQWKGVRKKERQLKEFDAQNANLIAWGQALGSKQTAAAALKQLAELNAKEHGYDLAELFGVKAETKFDLSQIEDEDERSMVERALAATDAKWAARFAALEAKVGKVDALEAEHQTAKQKAEYEANLKSAVPKVQARIKQGYLGFEVSEGKIREAMHANPEIKDPYKAVVLHFNRQLITHVNQRTGGKPAEKMAPATGKREREALGVGEGRLSDFFG